MQLRYASPSAFGWYVGMRYSGEITLSKVIVHLYITRWSLLISVQFGKLYVRKLRWFVAGRIEHVVVLILLDRITIDSQKKKNDCAHIRDIIKMKMGN